MYHLTPKSKNAKTGPIPVSTSTATTCPDACPFKKNGCYADGGPLAMHWRKVTEGVRGDDWETFCDKIATLPEGQLWRHNQSGDLPGEGDDVDEVALATLVDANKGKRGFTYTHKPPTGDNGRAISSANRLGFTVNLSANNAAHADELANLGVGPVVTVLPADFEGTKDTTPEGRPIAVCPAIYRDDVSCATCGLCQKRDRKVVVGFPAHGASKRKASAIAKGIGA